MLALSVPAGAEIVHTNVNQTMGRRGTLFLDLNQDGINDFELRELFIYSRGFASTSTWNNKLYVIPAPGAGVVQCDYIGVAGALSAGEVVGPGWKFLTGPALVRWDVALGDAYCVGGSWCYNTRAFVGLRLQINGQTHYGWARITAKFDYLKETIVTGLHDFAYETIPNRPIIAGQEHGLDSSLIPSHSPTTGVKATLGLLAQGAQGLAAWRREEQE